MNLCIPVTRNLGLKSPVSAHFGSAPLFLVVDTATGSCREIPNRNEHHAHGMCQPLESLAGERFDGIVVGGIGQGALGKLRATGVRVFRANAGTAEDAVAAFTSGALQEVTPASACAGHAHEHEDHVHPSDLPTR